MWHVGQLKPLVKPPEVVKQTGFSALFANPKVLGLQVEKWTFLYSNICNIAESNS